MSMPQRDARPGAKCIRTSRGARLATIKSRGRTAATNRRLLKTRALADSAGPRHIAADCARQAPSRDASGLTSAARLGAHSPTTPPRARAGRGPRGPLTRGKRRLHTENKRFPRLPGLQGCPSIGAMPRRRHARVIIRPSTQRGGSPDSEVYLASSSSDPQAVIVSRLIGARRTTRNLQDKQEHSPNPPRISTRGRARVRAMEPVHYVLRR